MTITTIITPQPISTAPKGELILLYCQRTAVVGGWWENSHEPGWWELGKYDKERGVWINDDYYPGNLTAQPTFWLSLPTPPRRHGCHSHYRQPNHNDPY